MKRLVALMLLLGASALCFAQNSIKVQAPNLVAVGEQFNLSFIIEGEESVSDFQWSPSDAFQLVWGPQRGSSTSISIVNGKKTKSSQVTYTYILLARTEGKFSLPAASARIGKDEVASRQPQIEVVADGGPSSAASQQPSQNSGTSQDAQQSQQARPSGQEASPSGDIFLRLSLSKTSAVVGETITATLKIYKRANLSGFENVKFPSFDGFWSQETVAPSSIDFHRENVGGSIYDAAVIRSWDLIPQRKGDLKIDPAEMTVLVDVRTPRASTGSIFDSFFQDDYQRIRKGLSSGGATVHVSGLPAGAPASFRGGVGNFRMNSTLTRDSLKVHDAASIKVTITGKGNVSMLEAPVISFPPDFEVYDVKTTDVPSGKSFEYPFIPRSYGDFVIDPVEYSYYDIAAGKYVTLRGEPMNISVAKTEGAETVALQQTGTGVIRKDVRDLGSDIRFIVSKPGRLYPSGTFFVGSALFWCLLIALALVAAAVYFVSVKVAARRADVVGSKGRAATKMARKRLSQAGVYLKGNLYTAFYEELHKTLLGFVSDKLNMDASEMSKDNIAQRLSESGAGDSLAAEFTSLLDACEFARYAPSSGHEAMNTHYESAVSIISALDQKMKRKTKTGAAAAAIALLLLMPVSGRAADTAVCDSLWNSAASAYAASAWDGAVEGWTAILDMGMESAELYFNIGNAFFKSGQTGRAILNYERALRLDPSAADVRFNLEYASQMCQDRIESVPEFFLKTWTRNLCWKLSSNAWAVLALLLFAITLAMLLVFLLSSSSPLRKTGFFSAIAALLLSVAALSFSLWQKADYNSDAGAVIMAAVTSAKSSPGSGTDLFVLHEGTVVNILERLGDWANVELSDGRQGWIKTLDMEVI